MRSFAAFSPSETPKSEYEEECILDRLLKRYLWTEFLLGLAVILSGWIFGAIGSSDWTAVSVFSGGPLLPAVGACMIGLSAQCAAHSTKLHGLAIAFGVTSLVFLAICAVNAFGYAVSRTDYADRGSSLEALLVLAVVVLIHCFLSLPLEGRADLNFLRRGVLLLAVFSAVAFLSIILTYLLSYVIYDSSLASLKAQDYLYSLEAGDRNVSGRIPELLQDFHYIEGVFAAAMGMTSARSVFRAFVGREPMEHPKELTE